MNKTPAKILVAEDNAENMYLVCFLLENAGYSLVTAVNGLDAVHLCQEALPDLVIMDIQMPIMDGLEATRQIKKIAETRHIPVVAFTAYAMTGDVDKALEAGCAGHIGKPMNVETFVQQIASYIKTP
jgi:two-component system, cell cycle response regulator DivK